MVSQVEAKDEAKTQAILPTDFVERLEASLAGADAERRRRLLYRRLKTLLPAILLVGPVLAWRLTLTSPDGLHFGISALAWLTFVVNVAVHVNTAVLSSLGLATLPSIIGVLLFLLIALALLTSPSRPHP